MRRFELSRDTLYILGLTLAALILRLLHLDTVRFNIDHAYPIWQALGTLDNGSLPVIGQASSVLFANPALTGYLYLPIVALTRSVLAVYGVVIALNTLAVLFTYLAARDLFRSDIIAPMAALLVAVNPWIVEYSRATWVQGLLPFWMSLLVWLLFPVLLGTAARPNRRLIAALVVLALLVQTYLLAFFVAGMVGLLLFIFRRRVPLRGLLVGGAVVALSTGVYGWGLLSNAETAFQRADNFSENPAQISGEALSHALRLVTGADYTLARSASVPGADLQIGLETAVHIGLTGLILLAIGSAIYKPVTVPAGLSPQGDAQRSIALILLLWFALPILAMSYTGNPVHPFYQLLGFPAGAILAAWGAALLTEYRVPWQAVGLVTVFAAGVMLLSSFRAADAVRAQPGQDAMLGLPLGDALALGQAINSHRPPDAPVYSSLDPFVLSAVSGRVLPVSSEVRLPETLILPQTGALYLRLTEGEAESVPLSEPGTRIALADGYTLAVDVVPPGGLQGIEVPEVIERPSEGGLTFYGYDLQNRRDDRWTLTTYWRVDAAEPLTSTDAFGPFVHVFNNDGIQIDNIGGGVVPGYLWQVGDFHVQALRFRAEPPFTLQVGQYDANASRNLIFIDEAGNYSPTVTIER